MGYPYSLVLGGASYYPRMGYRLAGELGVQVPPGIPWENFMAVPFQEKGKPLQGGVTYPEEFGL